MFAQAAARGNEWGGSPPVNIASPPAFNKPPNGGVSIRMRSGSGGSRTTTTSDSDSSPASFSAGTSFNSNHLSPPSHNTGLPNHAAAIATRMRERDADAMAQYIASRNRSGSQSTDSKSQNGSISTFSTPSAAAAVADELASIASNPAASGTTTPRRLRPSVSATQLRSYAPLAKSGSGPGRSPPSATITPTNASFSVNLPGAIGLTRSSSTKSTGRIDERDEEALFGTESPVFARLAGSPSSGAGSPPRNGSGSTTTTPTGRRLPFNLLGKTLALSPDREPTNHRRGVPATASR